ncbi:hypothetical protein [Streptomyces sp. NBC_00847]|uniref:hypothetical protein n=1 Tax=Streptomyces sp. NBC_00847 TaxID=2975850 RepID=UPI00225DE66B|nr:hypothetical protein [Streptomyces sp. NBC_00847]MCX4886063.1 hypothetical protein [Streptomyces sp. NBC_00847]
MRAERQSTAYCGGRLVLEPVCDDVRKSGAYRVFGGFRWLLDGEDVEPVVAEAFRIVWETDMFGRPCVPPPPRQCKDIDDDAFLDAVCRAARGYGVAMSWDVQSELESVLGPIPPNLFTAKARRLIARRVLGGCVCGCQGDFHLPYNCPTPADCCRSDGN